MIEVFLLLFMYCDRFVLKLGFYVGRTKDVISASKNSNGKDSKVYIQDLSIVDVPVEDVRILSLSADDSILVVCGVANIHFFSVDSLLKKVSRLRSSLTVCRIYVD